jgi:hypothetical protein
MTLFNVKAELLILFTKYLYLQRRTPDALVIQNFAVLLEYPLPQTRNILINILKFPKHCDSCFENIRDVSF